MMTDTERKAKEISGRWVGSRFLEKFRKIGESYARQIEGERNGAGKAERTVPRR